MGTTPIDVAIVEYVLMCGASGFLGAFVTSFPAYKGRKYFKSNWRVLIQAVSYSIFLSKLVAMVIAIFLPSLVIQPPYPISFIIGAVMAYILIDPSEDKNKRAVKILDSILGKVGLQIKRDKNEDKSDKE